VFVPLLPPGAGSEGDAVVDPLVRAVAIVTCVGINTTVGATDNAVVAIVGVAVVIGVIPWQRQGRQSIGCFHSFSATVVATTNTVADNVAAISGTISLPE